MKHQSYSVRRERGAALVVALILLVVMTLLGIAAVRTTLLEERMSGNMLDRSFAFQAAEAALRAGEDIAYDRPAMPANGCSAGLCATPVTGAAPRWTAPGFWDTGSGNYAEISNATFAKLQSGNKLSVKPRYIVELVAQNVSSAGSCTTKGDVSPDAQCTGTENRYRITSRVQESGRSEVILQSIYAVP